MSLPAPSHLRVLCFGASITAGFHRFGLAYHPYSRQLKKELERAFPNTKLDICVDAAPGDLVLGGSYIHRLEQQIMLKTKYDWIIVQGGGNDLIQGSEPQAIFEGLQSIWRKALSSGAKVMSLTVTETSDERSDMRARYHDLNQKILNHREGGVFPFDLCSAMPYHDLDVEKRKALWDDGLHFKKPGYDLMGSVISQGLKEIMFEGKTSKL